MIDKISKDIFQYRRVLIAGHIAPDADAVCSATALAASLIAKGITAKVYFADQLSSQLKTVSAKVPVVHEVPLEPFDCLIAVDTASETRLGDKYADLRGKAGLCITIDHHVSNEGWGDVNYIDPEAPSTCSIILDILRRIDEALITPAVASSLYAGMMDDTGGFCYSNTTAKSLADASELVAAGAKPHVVSQALYESKSVETLRLTAASMGTLRKIASGEFAVMHVDFKMIKEAGATAADAEGLSNQVKQLHGVKGAIFLRQTPRGWKISLRSKSDDLDVNLLASQFGGGGHRAAAGCTIPGELEDVILKLEDAIK